MLKKIYLKYEDASKRVHQMKGKTWISCYGIFSGLGYIELDSIVGEEDIDTCKSKQDHYVTLFFERMQGMVE